MKCAVCVVAAILAVCVPQAGGAPLPAASAKFLQDPADYVREGVSLKAVEHNKDGVFPNGPNPFLSGYAMNRSAMAAAKAAGMTVAGTFSGIYNLSNHESAHAVGLKSIFQFRDFRGNNRGGTSYQLVRIFQGKPDATVSKQEFEESVRSHMRKILEHPTPGLNESVVCWDIFGDDMLECPYTSYSKPGSFSTRSANDSKPYKHTRKEFLDAIHWYGRIILDYDDPQTGHKNGLKRGLQQLPFEDAYTSKYGYIHRKYLHEMSVWPAQAYWGYDAVAKYLKVYLSMYHVWDMTDRMARLARGVPGATFPSPTGKPRVVAPTLWGASYLRKVPDREPAVLNNPDATRRTQTALIMVKMMAGATGIYVYQYRSGKQYNFSGDDYFPNLIRSINKHSLFHVCIWGKDVSSDFRITHVNAHTWSYVALYQPDLVSGPPTFHNPNADMTMWKAYQYKGKRYLCIVNGMPDKHEHAMFARTVRNYPPAGVNGKAGVDGIRTRYDFTPNLQGVKCTEVIGDAKSVTIDMHNGVIDVDLPGSSAAVFVFEPDIEFFNSSTDSPFRQ